MAQRCWCAKCALGVGLAYQQIAKSINDFSYATNRACIIHETAFQENTMAQKSSPPEEHAFAGVCTNLDIPAIIHDPLRAYVTLLMKWNASMNLVGARTWQSCVENLVLDSVYVAQFLRTLALSDEHHTWDFGAGAGLPGIPLRMLWEHGHYTMVEAREKRALFLQTVLAQVPLARSSVFAGRVEHFFSVAPTPAYMVISRAFMPWAQLVTLVEGAQENGHINNDARIIFLALDDAPEAALQAMGWYVECSYQYFVNNKARYLWSVRRVTGGR